jgi:alpha-tubulin suppressor-like RCC1 family protein
MKKLLLTTILFLQLTTIALAQPGSICWRKFSAGKDFNLAIRFDGTLWGWGANFNQLGLGFAGNQNTPIQIGTANDWMEISAGFNHSLAIKQNGTLWSWGDGLNGALGNGSFASVSLVPTQVGVANDWMLVSAGTNFSLAIKTNNTLWSWGKNNVGQLGDGGFTDTNVPNQISLPPPSNSQWIKIEAGHEHSLALATPASGGFNELYSWGNNTSGQLGNGNNVLSNFPLLIAPSPTFQVSFVEISAGFDHSLAISNTTGLFSWGSNNKGQLGNGSLISQNTPTPVNTDWIKISAGDKFSLGIKSFPSINATKLYSWGNNTQGNLGLGNLTLQVTPNQVGTLTTWNDVSAGEFHGLSEESGTNLWSAGRNAEGQLGDGSNTQSQVLVPVICGGSLSTQSNVTVVNEISVYPNPATTILNIKSSNPILNISISDINGRLIQETKQSEINIEQFSKGIYVMKIKTENGVSTQKIMKE